MPATLLLLHHATRLSASLRVTLGASSLCPSPLRTGASHATPPAMTELLWKYKVPWLVAVVVVCVGFDQGSKLWALDALTRPATPEEIAVDVECRDRSHQERRKLRDEARKGGAADPCASYQQGVVTRYGSRVELRRIEVVDGWFAFKYAENPAAAFSMTESIPESARRPLLLMISLFASVGIAVWYLKLKEKDWAIFVAFPLIISGALGNFIDRARLAYVIDFLDAYLSAPAGAVSWLVRNFGTTHWPTFNIADTCIVIGAGLVVFRTIRPLPKEVAPPEEGAVDAKAPA